MLDQTAFLESIAAAPADDTTRLVYADWLAEHGNPHHADLIRQQCGLFPLKKRPTRMVTAAMGACREVLAWEFSYNVAEGVRKSHSLTAVARKNRDVIVKPGHHLKRYDRYTGAEVGYTDYNWVLFRRGFVSLIYCLQATWKEHGDAIRRDHPGVAWTQNTLLQYADNTYLQAGHHLPAR